MNQVKKVLAIDGMGLLYAITPALNMERIDFGKLYQLLEKTGTTPFLSGSPLITLSESATRAFGPVFKRLGFKVVEKNTTKNADLTSDDDLYLIDHLSKADVNQIAEIVFVGVDFDFGPILLKKALALKERHPDHGKPFVYIVGTRYPGEERRAVMGKDMERLIAENPGIIEFVELGEYAQWLEYKEPGKEPDLARARTPVKNPEIVAEVISPETLPVPMNGANGHMNGHSEEGLSIIIETEEGRSVIHPRSITDSLLNALFILGREPGVVVSCE